MVALEIGTGTWCTYCPGAAMGADDLLENGKKVAVIENHNGDAFANTYSNTRNSYYNVPGYPTAYFDGILSVVGGSHNQSMYSSYLPKYNQRMAALANLTLSMVVTHTGLNYTAVITINKVGTITATDLKLHFFVTQSNILYNWQGQTHLEHVNRLMVPNQNGTAISFASGNTQEVTLNFTMNVAWPIQDCEFITLVQSQASKEEFNCIKQGTINLTPDFTASATQVNQGDPVTFTNATTGGYIGVPENTYLWSFPGGNPATSTLENPVVTYIESGSHDVSLSVTRGGQVETLTKTQYINVGTGTTFAVGGTITYANAPATPLSEITLNLKNSSGTIVGTTTTSSPGTYSFGGLFNGDYTLEASTAKTWGGVSAADVLLFKKHIANISFLNGIFLASGDVNGSGGLTSADILSIKRRLANTITTFTVGDWLFNNTAISINGSNVNQDFNGLCYGDANGSYVPVVKNSPAIGQSGSRSGSFTIGTIGPVAAGQITVPVYATQVSNLGSFQFTIEYNPDMLTFNSVSAWYPGLDGVTSGEPMPGKLTFVWAADNTGINIPDNILCNLNFTWKGTSSTSSLSWSDVPTQREFGDYDGNIFVPEYNNGSVTGAPVGIYENVTQPMNVYPNPASEMIDIRSDVNISRIELISFTGQVVLTKTDIFSKLARISVSDLQSGIYFVKATTDQGIKTTKITVVH
jgi:hypothetical protein